jgi:hypothetical protein
MDLDPRTVYCVRRDTFKVSTNPDDINTKAASSDALGPSLRIMAKIMTLSEVIGFGLIIPPP